MQRQLRGLVAIFIFGLFSPLCFSYSDDDYTYYNDDNGQYQYQNHNENYSYYSNDNWDDDRYSERYANNYPDYDDGYNEEQHYRSKHRSKSSHSAKKTVSRLASTITPPGEKVVIVDPRVHRWGAYDPQGNLLREGLMSAGSGWCGDLGRSCHTSVGTFRILSFIRTTCQT